MATPEQKAKEKAREEAQQQKRRNLKNDKQTYINLVISLNLDPRDYRDIIEQAAKNGWGRETFLKRAGLESAAISAGEQEAFLEGILGDYEEAYGIPASQELIEQLRAMDTQGLAAYNAKLQKVLEQKQVKEQSKNEYLSALTAKYVELWGSLPPPGYVDGKAGLNIYEFEAQERKKPEFKQFSPVFRQEFEDRAGGFLTGLGVI